MVRRRHLLVAGAQALLATAGTLAFAGEAHAQALLERFDPAERGSRFFVADSLELEGSTRFATGVVTSYATNLRTFRQSGADPERSDLVAHSLWIHPGASLVLAPGARFALDVPIALQRGDDVSLDRKGYRAPGSPRMGDVRASFDVRLAGSARPDVDGAVLAAGVVAWLPTGSASDYTGDDFARVGARVASAFRAGPLLGAARIGLTYRNDSLDPFARVSLGSEANAVLALGLRMGPVVLGPELHGATIVKDAFQRRSSPVEVLGGGHLTLGGVQIGLGVGGTVVTGLGAPRLRGVVSLEWTPGTDSQRDRDRDGVLDADDLCPDVPGLRDAPLGAAGCPAAPRDGDGDGIIDRDDACPDLAGIRSRDVMAHGCPDADRDGVPDPLDACPSVSGERSVLPRFDGCPPDADGDGVTDALDACPDLPGDASPDRERNGCPPPPPPPDADGDGIPDSADACPRFPGPEATLPQVHGCPTERPEGAIALPVEPGATALTAESDPVVVRLAAGLLAHPDVRVLVVGAPAPRARRGAKRAQLPVKVIVDRLVELGVKRTRIDARRAKGAAARHPVVLRVVVSAPP